MGSLFAGVGGFDLGFERAGHELVWHSEIERHACAVLRERWPDVPNIGDVTRIGGAAIPPVDVICGGFPCQDLSVAGKRRGFGGERSVLAFEFLRIVREMREATDGESPTYLVLENVPGLFSSAGGRDFGALLDALAELRPLDIAWRVLDSRYFNVAQRRERVFIVVDFGGERALQVLFEPESLRGDSPARGAKREDVAGTLGGGSSERGWSDDTDRATFVCGAVSSKWAKGTGGPAGDECYNLVAPTLRAGGNATGGHRPPGTDVDTCESLVVTHTLRADGFDASEDGTGRGTPLTVIPFDERNVTSPDNRSRCLPGEPCHTLHEGAPAVAFQESQSGSYEYEEAGTLRANGPGHDPVGTRVRCSSGVRRLTPRECERLQGFPDDWTRWGRREDGTRYELADGPRYRCMGNAVTVNVAEWIGRRLSPAPPREEGK